MRFLGTINRGAFGIVQRVRLDDGSVVAKKVFDPEKHVLERTGRDKLRARFVREVRVQSSLPAELFLPIIAYDLTGDQPWFTMPVAERTFAQQIAKDRRTRIAISTKPLADILNALEELHSLGYVHRDLKPANVLLHDGIWKLADFGFVQPPVEKTTGLTSIQSGWGTYTYCAPEQAQDFRRSTPSVDIYSFGCILHDVYSGRTRVPYQKQTCEGPIGWIVEKCTEVEPSRRFRTVAAVREALFSVLSESTIAKGSPESQEWVTSLDEVDDWSLSRMEEFVRYLRSVGDSRRASQIYVKLDEHCLRRLNEIDSDLWESTALHICDWVRGSFDFDYCDVLIRRLELIFELGDIECKASAAISAAVLGASHNRYYVMRRLFALCGPNLEERLATRIAIQICVDDVQENFQKCAEQLGRSVHGFHPKIAAVVSGVAA
jgi:serine/threonine protein kinase